MGDKDVLCGRIVNLCMCAGCAIVAIPKTGALAAISLSPDDAFFQNVEWLCEAFRTMFDSSDSRSI